MSEKHFAYCIAGGWPSNPDILNRCLRRALDACKKEHPNIAYVGTASGDDQSFFHNMESVLRKAGASEVALVPLAGKAHNAGAAEQMLKASDAVFLSGGEVEDGMKWLHFYGIDRVLRDLFESGKVFFGLSAGSIMMGSHWVHWDNAEDDTTASLFDCLGFIPTVFDTHAEDENWKELKTALRLLGPGAKGFGIPSNGMLLADSEGGLTNLEGKMLPFRNCAGAVKKV